MIQMQTPDYFPDYYGAAGVDEVGRGALFGPVAAAAVILDPEDIPRLQALGVKDSKQVPVKKRSQLAGVIASLAVACQIGTASVEEIDRLNILRATFLAMQRAIAALPVTPRLCLIDGNQTIPDLAIPQRAIVGGDRTCIVIAAASIVAKVWRDRLLEELAQQYPQYHLAQNKGYGTRTHRLALSQYGPTPLHRSSFKCQQN